MQKKISSSIERSIKIITLLTLFISTICHLNNNLDNQKNRSNKEEDLINENKPLMEKLKFLSSESEGCWLNAMGRGIGKPIHTCKNGFEQSGLLCYPNCDPDFTGVGPVCWQTCLNNFRDDGAFCFKSAAYGRGAGYLLSNKLKCENENPEGCEQYGLLYYPKCKSTYHNVGCCICSPDCQEGMTDIGISCAKKSYGRGVGLPLTCSEAEDYDSGLCYKLCQDGFKGIGPICWGSCPVGYDKCGALCLKGQTCDGEIKQYVDGVIDIVHAFASQNYIEGVIDILKFAKEFIYPICK